MCEMLYDKCFKKKLGFNKEVQQWDLTNSRNLATWAISPSFRAEFVQDDEIEQTHQFNKKTNWKIRVQ